MGREQELDDVRQLLHENRLVTLVGPGGTGKTRLSLKAADELKELFIDGVWLIELASINDPTLVDQTVAAVLRIQEQPGRPILQSISTYLRRKQLLLLLDNCEHLVDASAKTAAALLQACPDVRILASSREGLGIAGESVYPLHPLALPEDKETSEAIAEYEAVRLFLTRAEQVRPDFKLNDANAPFVARICRRLDGIPLAIELAAARMKHLTPKQIAARLDQSFRLLTGGSRAALPRQQTLRALIDWSYELLSPAERLLFQRLAVFHGGWTLAAAEEVCAQGKDDSSCLDPFEILDLNGSLVEKSMIELDLQSAEPRYKLLETMRQYGLEKLKETGEALLIRDNHLTYYSTMALEAELPILRRQEQEAIERLDADHDNIVAALEWASSGSLEPFLNFVVALNPYWSSVSYAAEARYWLDQVLSDVDLSSPTSSESKQLDRIGQALFYQGLMAFVQGDNTSAATALEQSYNTSLQSGNLFFAAQSLGLRSPALMHIGRLDDALASAQEALQIARQLGDDQLLSRCLSALGGTMVMRNSDDAEGWAYLEESVAYSRSAGDTALTITPLLVMTEVALSTGDLDLAWEKVNEGLEVVITNHNKTFGENFRTKAADIHRLQGKYAEAILIYQHAVTTWREIGNVGAMARCIECLAYIEIGRAEKLSADRKEQVLLRASRLLGAAEKIRETPGAEMPFFEQAEYDQHVALLKSQLDAAALSSSWAQGRDMSIVQAEDYALNEINL